MRKVVIVVSLFSLLTGCASPARVENMKIYNISSIHSASNSNTMGTVLLGEVTGGKKTTMLKSQVSNLDFTSALEQSLKLAGLLSESDEKCKYILKADLVYLLQPMFEVITLQVTAQVEYSLLLKESGKEIYKEQFVTPFTATYADSPLEYERLRIANEGAIRTSIEKITTRLVSMRIDGETVTTN